MKEFLDMGGYAFYVWTSYGFFAVVMLWITVSPIIRKRALLREISDRQARDERKRGTST